MLPNRLIVRAYLSRGARIWLVARAMLSGVFLLATVNPLRVSALAALGIVLLTVAVSVLDTHRRRERVLLANLGVSLFAIGALLAIPALIGEIVLHVCGTLI